MTTGRINQVTISFRSQGHLTPRVGRRAPLDENRRPSDGRFAVRSVLSYTFSFASLARPGYLAPRRARTRQLLIPRSHKSRFTPLAGRRLGRPTSGTKEKADRGRRSPRWESTQPGGPSTSCLLSVLAIGNQSTQTSPMRARHGLIRAVRLKAWTQRLRPERSTPFLQSRRPSQADRAIRQAHQSTRSWFSQHLKSAGRQTCLVTPWTSRFHLPTGIPRPLLLRRSPLSHHTPGSHPQGTQRSVAVPSLGRQAQSREL